MDPIEALFVQHISNINGIDAEYTDAAIKYAKNLENGLAMLRNVVAFEHIHPGELVNLFGERPYASIIN